MDIQTTAKCIFFKLLTLGNRPIYYERRYNTICGYCGSAIDNNNGGVYIINLGFSCSQCTKKIKTVVTEMEHYQKFTQNQQPLKLFLTQNLPVTMDVATTIIFKFVVNLHAQELNDNKEIVAKMLDKYLDMEQVD